MHIAGFEGGRRGHESRKMWALLEAGKVRKQIFP